ncbi:mRNA splicing factorCwf21 [Penicillium sp. IBT 31633x]|nr:mRNA splicing factorCwf21 [Penicillium sp. IBT 31633x]
MSSNVGLSTPRGSGTSGYVQRNSALLKTRNTGYGAPYPPVSGANGSGPMDRPFKQRVPDKQILEHDRKRAIEVKVMEERERLEEANEKIEEEIEKNKKKGKGAGKAEAKNEEDGEADEDEKKVLSEEEIDERCEVLRQLLLKELEEDLARGESGFKRPLPGSGAGRDRRNLKSYQVHELAEAKIQETERLRRAFGLREDRETGEISSSRGDRERRRD